MALVGAPASPSPLNAFALLVGGKRLAGSMIGGIKETQEMLDHRAVIPIQKINEAYERVLESDVRYRFVLDLASMRS